MGDTTLREHDHKHAENRFAVLPTTFRIGAAPDRTARGVTIAFLDSGFYPHPDLTQPVSRIIAYKDVTNPQGTLKSDRIAEQADWHGTMTSVAAAGNGFLSDGFYRGLASEAQVVLVRVSENGRITEPNIERGLRWVIENKDRYNIRVVSISLGGDEDVPSSSNAVDQAAEDAVKAGIVVVVAAGNSGCNENHRTVPPANSPSVITVGGYHDNNQIEGAFSLYCSSYGTTADGNVKPEIIAPAMWVAAPILPTTDEYRRAEALSQLASSPDYKLEQIARPSNGSRESSDELWRRAGLDEEIRESTLGRIRTEVESLLKEHKIVATHYQHVDGTSFAAPVVASVVAQMIEENPRLSPAAIKHILISTAYRIQGAPAIRQGFGVLNARLAVKQAARERHEYENTFFCPPRVNGGKLEFTYHNDSAEHVALVGDFNQWSSTAAPYQKHDDGTWRVRIDVLQPGRYRYKLVVNGEQWTEDPANAMKEPDEYGGFNSILHIS